MTSFSPNCLLGIITFPNVNQETRNHGARPALARLAVNDSHVVRVALQPGVDVGTELTNDVERGRGVVGHRVVGHAVVEEGGAILRPGGSGRAKVVDFVAERKLNLTIGIFMHSIHLKKQKF